MQVIIIIFVRKFSQLGGEKKKKKKRKNQKGLNATSPKEFFGKNGAQSH